jgi:outer membrane biosynthesis protein TonB
VSSRAASGRQRNHVSKSATILTTKTKKKQQKQNKTNKQTKQKNKNEKQTKNKTNNQQMNKQKPNHQNDKNNTGVNYLGRMWLKSSGHFSRDYILYFEKAIWKGKA